MRKFLGILVLIGTLYACVPAKKYNALLAKQQNCQEQLEKYKTSALDNQSHLKTARAKLNLVQNQIEDLKVDTNALGEKYRSLKAKYRHAMAVGSNFEEKLAEIKNSDARHLARMQSNLEEKMLEVQEKEDKLHSLAQELQRKQELLVKREARVKELETILAKQKSAVQDLKRRIAKALKGFEGKGIEVYQKNGRIHVRLEAKLLFASGSTKVSPEGKKAIIQLANAVKNEKDLEIIVEGHTDSDPMRSATHPKDNWELSVLRATSVVEIMTENTEINPKILAASGRSKYHPVGDNKAKNRRIEVIIAPNLHELFKVIGE